MLETKIEELLNDLKLFLASRKIVFDDYEIEIISHYYGLDVALLFKSNDYDKIARVFKRYTLFLSKEINHITPFPEADGRVRITLQLKPELLKLSKLDRLKKTVKVYLLSLDEKPDSDFNFGIEDFKVDGKNIPAYRILFASKITKTGEIRQFVEDLAEYFKQEGFHVLDPIKVEVDRLAFVNLYIAMREIKLKS